MPNGESVSPKKLILPLPPPKARKKKRRRKRSRSKKRGMKIHPSMVAQKTEPKKETSVQARELVVEELVFDDLTQENTQSEPTYTEEIHTEELAELEKMNIEENNLIPRELTINTFEEEATEKIELVKDEERTDIVSPEFYQDTDPIGEEITEPLEETENVVTQAHVHTTHKNELKHLFLFGCSLFFFGLLPYSSETFAKIRPWNQGEPIPVLSLLYSNQQVVEDEQGNIALAALDPDDPLLSTDDVLEEITLEEINLEQVEAPQAGKPVENSTIIEEAVIVEDVPASIVSTSSMPEARSPARPSPLIIPPNAMDHYFQKLWQVEHKKDQIARALVWGDSTIAADGIIKDVRRNMQEKFGNAGSGFLPIALNSAWTIRKEILRTYSGWKTDNYVYGKLESKRYGLAGMVSSSFSTSSKATLAGPKTKEGRIPSTRYQIFYRAQPKGGNFQVDIGEGPIDIETMSDEFEERTIDLYAPKGSEKIEIQTKGDGLVTIYGVALESQGYGVTWETLGVAGASISSMRKQDKGHMHEQVAHRDPALVVYWTGGNELGYPSLKSKTGAGYKKVYRNAVKKIRDGHPQASCLLIGPLDQGEHTASGIQSKPSLAKLIRFQKEVALEQGCAYWDAQDAMGGANSFSKWMSHKPKLASSDMSHLTGRGRRIIGDTLSDVIEHSYQSWLAQHPNGIE